MRLHLSWSTVQRTIQLATPALEEWHPTVLVAISGGGSIPARILRSCLKTRTGHTLPTQTIGLMLYDDDQLKTSAVVQRTQWLDPAFDVQGQRVLLVDEVDDSRRTLSYAVAEMLLHFKTAESAYNARRTASDPAWVEPQLAVFVVHNKRRVKAAELPEEFLRTSYFCGAETDDNWHVYPWDAADIDAHNAMADAQEQAASQAMTNKPLTFQQSVAKEYCSAYRSACVAMDDAAKVEVQAPLPVPVIAAAAAAAVAAVASVAAAAALPAGRPPAAAAAAPMNISYQAHLQTQYMAALRGACIAVGACEIGGMGAASAPRSIPRVPSACGLASASASPSSAPMSMLLS